MPAESSKAIAASLFMVAAGESFNIFSAVNSSPWTAESFGADERRARAAWEYVMIAGAANLALGAGFSVLAGNWYPLAGTAFITAFMAWLYRRALRRGVEAGSDGWANDG